MSMLSSSSKVSAWVDGSVPSTIVWSADAACLTSIYTGKRTILSTAVRRCITTVLHLQLQRQACKLCRCRLARLHHGESVCKHVTQLRHWHKHHDCSATLQTQDKKAPFSQVVASRTSESPLRNVSEKMELCRYVAAADSFPGAAWPACLCALSACVAVATMLCTTA